MVGQILKDNLNRLSLVIASTEQMRRPAINTVIPYTLGILVAEFLSIPAFWIWLIVLMFLISSFILQHRPERGFHVGNIECARIPQMFLLLTIFACGMLRVEIFPDHSLSFGTIQ